jgi:hypothetical protein
LRRAGGGRRWGGGLAVRRGRRWGGGLAARREEIKAVEEEETEAVADGISP